MWTPELPTLFQLTGFTCGTERCDATFLSKLVIPSSSHGMNWTKPPTTNTSSHFFITLTKMDLTPQLQTDPFSSSRTAVNSWAWKAQDRKKGAGSAPGYRQNPQPRTQPFPEEAFPTTAFSHLLAAGSPHSRWSIQPGGSSCHCLGLPEGSPCDDQKERKQMRVKPTSPAFFGWASLPFYWWYGLSGGLAPRA